MVLVGFVLSLALAVPRLGAGAQGNGAGRTPGPARCGTATSYLAWHHCWRRITPRMKSGERAFDATWAVCARHCPGSSCLPVT